MTSTRPILLFALLLAGYFIYSAWEQDYAAKPQTVAATTPANPTVASTGNPPSAAAPSTTASSGNDVPATVNAAAGTMPAQTSADVVSGPTIEVHTDVLRVAISTNGGSVVRADLLEYPLDPHDKTVPVRLLDDSDVHFFEAQSGLVSSSETTPGHKAPAPDHRAVFSAEKTDYRLSPDGDKIEVPLSWSDASGLAVRKVYIFTRGSYLIEMRQEIRNGGSMPWQGIEYRQLQRVPPVKVKSGLFSLYNPEAYAFAGAAWYSPTDKFQKLPFAKFAESPLKHDETGGWAAMLQHYFFAAWIPNPTETDEISTSISSADTAPRYLIRAVAPPISVAPGATTTLTTRLYVGPKLQSEIANIAPGLELTADYGILTIISQPLHWILVHLQKLVGNWGVAIILLVVLIKLVLYKPSESQYRSMAKMKKFQPRLQALKERYGDDKAKLNAATMELYQKEKINPLGGCLPVLIQMPIFLGLLWVLQESVELRQAPFFGWIQNLSAPDPLFILPILNGIAMLATQWLSPAAPGMDPMQARMMKVMPLIFAGMFAFAPAGLTLYWTVNAWLSLLQQWIITKRVGSATAIAKA